jgi:hypothetical protein
MLNTFENSQTATSRRLERERQLELMNHAANGTGPFAANNLDSHGSWDDDDIDESLMLDVEGARAAGRPKDTYQISTYSDTSSNMTVDEARMAAMAALEAADRDHNVNKSYTERKVVSRSPERFRWSPPNVPQIDTSRIDVMEESLEEKTPSSKDYGKPEKINRRSHKWMYRSDGEFKSVSRRQALAVLLCFLLAFAVMVSVIVSVSHKRRDAASENASSPVPTSQTNNEVLSSELQQRIASYVSIITSQDVSSPKVFEDSKSPQYKALLWMALNELDGPTELTTEQSTELICNIYGLVVLYYSNIEPGDKTQFIHGTPPTSSSLQPIDFNDPVYRDAAENKTGETEPVNFTIQWLSTPFHCTWTGVECFSTKDSADGTAGYGIVKTLNLTMRGLVGSILEDVPKALNDMMTLDLGYNKLTGPIPVSIGSIRYANQIFLGGNQLKGTIPSTIGHLMFLDDLYLQENRLTGSIPKEIGNMKQLCK